ncbi:hypothetical protein BSK60_32590, partial [Paenibacillus odorifer]
LYGLTNSLDTLNDIAVYVKVVGNANRVRKTFINPRVIHLSQIHDNSFRLQRKKVRVRTSIRT